MSQKEQLALGVPRVELQQFSSQEMIDKLLFASRLLLGCVFISSGVLKLISPQQATDLLSELSSLEGIISKVVILLGSVVECLIGVMLIASRKHIRLAALISSTVLLLFTFVGVWALQNPRSCGCFGEVLDMKTDEYLVLRNIILLLISMFVFRYSEQVIPKGVKGTP